MHHDQTLVLHPEIQQLTEENELLRDEFASLLTEVEDLIQPVKPDLLALYQTKIGVGELRLFQAQFDVARLRRQIELAQGSINRGERPDLIAIECAFEQEFQEWMTKLEETGRRIQEAKERLKHLLSPEEGRELKKLHCALVKRLHPDVNPNGTEDQRRLWLRAQSAYEAGDLPELRALSLLAEKSAPIPPSKSVDNLRQDQKTLCGPINAQLAKVAKIESSRRSRSDSSWMMKLRWPRVRRNLSAKRASCGNRAKP